jgi:hypothetical protein
MAGSNLVKACESSRRELLQVNDDGRKKEILEGIRADLEMARRYFILVQKMPMKLRSER